MGIRILSDTLTPGMGKLSSRLDAALWATVSAHAPRTQGHAQITAPWNDVTGNARQGLTATPGRGSNVYFIDLYHRMPYGIWLETRWSGRYQVIVPTIQKMGKELMVTTRAVMRKL